MWDRHIQPKLKFYPKVKATFHEVPGKRAARLIAPHKDIAVYWIFIDGCHCRECVTDELAAWAPIIEPGGFICCHDYDPGYQDPKDNPRLMGQRYHDNEPRKIAVYEAVEGLRHNVLGNFEEVARVSANDRGNGVLFGGLIVLRKKVDASSEISNSQGPA